MSIAAAPADHRPGHRRSARATGRRGSASALMCAAGAAALAAAARARAAASARLLRTLVARPPPRRRTQSRPVLSRTGRRRDATTLLREHFARARHRRCSSSRARGGARSRRCAARLRDRRPGAHRRPLRAQRPRRASWCPATSRRWRSAAACCATTCRWPACTGRHAQSGDGMGGEARPPALRRAMFTNEELRPAMRHLKQGGVLWYAPDQDMRGKDTVFVPFFGVPAHSLRHAPARAPAGAPWCVPPPPRRRRLHAARRPALTDFPSDDATADTARVMAAIEAMVRARRASTCGSTAASSASPTAWPRPDPARRVLSTSHEQCATASTRRVRREQNRGAADRAMHGAADQPLERDLLDAISRRGRRMADARRSNLHVAAICAQRCSFDWSAQI